VTHDVELARQMHRRLHIVDGALEKDERMVEEA
jgi:hypothetical protein